MGAGSSKAGNAINLVDNALSQAAINATNATISDANVSNIINIDGSGNLNIGQINQDLKATVNTSNLFAAMTDLQNSQQITQDITQQATALTKGLNFGNASEAGNNLNDFVSIVTQSFTNIKNTCESYASGSNQVNIQLAGSGNNVSISGINQDALASVFANCVDNTVANSLNQNDLSQKLSQTATAKTIGLSLDFLVWIIIGGLVFLGFGLYLANNTKAGRILLMILGLVFLGVGGYLLYDYEKGKRTISVDAYSFAFEDLPLCGASGRKTANSTKKNDLMAECINSLSCAAFECLNYDNTDGRDACGEAYIYTSLAKPDCNRRVSDQDIKPALVSPVVNLVSLGSKAPSTGLQPDTAQSGAAITAWRPGDLVIDTDSGNIWRYKLTPSNSASGPAFVGEWVANQPVPLTPDFDTQNNVYNNTRTLYTTLIKGTPPTLNYKVINGSFWKPGSGQCVPSQVQANTLYFFNDPTFYDSVPFIWVDANSNCNYGQTNGYKLLNFGPNVDWFTGTNWTGVTLVQRKTWKLYVGIAFLVFGIIALAFGLGSKSKEEKKSVGTGSPVPETSAPPVSETPASTAPVATTPRASSSGLTSPRYVQ